MPSLPIVETPSALRQQKTRWAITVHICRVGLLVGILMLIRQKHVDFVSIKPDADRLNQIEIGEISQLIPAAASIQRWDPTNQSRSVVAADFRQVASLLQTSPASVSVVGYLGPTNVMVVLNPEQKILHVQILESADTIQHVDVVRDSKEFLRSFNGLPWNRPEHWPEIDAVSGATLTSYAIVQGLSARAGRQAQNLKFPNKITESEIRINFGSGPEQQLVGSPVLKRGQLVQVNTVQINTDSKVDNTPLGYLARTSPAADSLVGYQGPTDTLLVLDRDMKLTDLKVRSSFDNQPYVGYLEDDTYLKDLLAGMSLTEIASFPEEVYEGVSGATMTSLNVLAGVRHTAGDLSESLKQQSQQSARKPQFDLPWRDLGTGLICLFGIVMGLTRLRTRKRLRLGYLMVVIVYLGFISGDMLSQAILIGWTQNGLPISVAPGLVFLGVAALAVPIFSKHNVYCSHICPMGAIQQLSKNRIRRKIQLSRWMTFCLKLIPGFLILFVLLTAFKQIDLNLASLEAFDAFSFRVAGWITISIALAGLAFSLFVPMAYCRFGCPTGAILNFARFNSNSGSIGDRDLLAIAALTLGMML